MNKTYIVTKENIREIYEQLSNKLSEMSLMIQTSSYSYFINKTELTDTRISISGKKGSTCIDIGDFVIIKEKEIIFIDNTNDLHPNISIRCVDEDFLIALIEKDIDNVALFIEDCVGYEKAAKKIREMLLPEITIVDGYPSINRDTLTEDEMKEMAISLNAEDNRIYDALTPQSDYPGHEAGDDIIDNLLNFNTLPAYIHKDKFKECQLAAKNKIMNTKSITKGQLLFLHSITDADLPKGVHVVDDNGDEIMPEPIPFDNETFDVLFNGMLENLPDMLEGLRIRIDYRCKQATFIGDELDTKKQGNLLRHLDEFIREYNS